MVSHDEIYQKVRRIVSEQIGINIDKIVWESNLRDDLDADSLALMELVMALEFDFGCGISDEEMYDLTTVKSIVDLMQSKKENTNA